MNEIPMDADIIRRAKLTLSIEAEAIAALNARLDGQFVAACQQILKTKGRVVVTGMGKSGHIGKKIAATLASTGTPSFFMHPAEASHGDLGMLTAEDLLLAISNSGESSEILAILPRVKRLQVPIIAMTGNASSSLAEHADIHLDISVEKEACPLNLAPTASTTVTLALGDALAVALLEARGFRPEDFADSHPGGKLGKRLLTRVTDLMRKDNLPIADVNMSVLDALLVMSKGGLGMIMLLDAQQQVTGVFTDGDLRRLLAANAHQLHQLSLKDYINPNPSVIDKNALATEALSLLERKKITALPVLDENNRLVGALSMHDLLTAGIA